MAIEYFNRPGYLLVKASPPWMELTAILVIEGAKIEATKRGHRHILLDLTQWSQPDSELTRIKSGEHLAQVLYSPFKVAAFAAPEFINGLGEKVAVNQGAWFRVFPDELSAIQWLNEGQGEI